VLRHPRYPAFAKEFDDTNVHIKINQCPIQRHVSKQKCFITALGFISTFDLSPLIEKKTPWQFCS
jgi:hypothetical protein